MPWRYKRYPSITIGKKSNSLRRQLTKTYPKGHISKRAEDLLDLIRKRKNDNPNIWHNFPELQPVENRPCTADAWQVFKKNFVEEYGGEKIQATGMTHSEFWEYFRTGRREADEGSKLRRLLKELHKDGS